VSIVAARCLAESGRRLTAFTSIPLCETAMYTGSYFGDELPFARAVAETAGNIDLRTVQAAGVSPVAAIRRALETSLEPKHGACNMYWLLDMLRTAARAGHGTLLSGVAGNGSISWAGDPRSHRAKAQIRILGWLGWLRSRAKMVAPRSFVTRVRCYQRSEEWQRYTAIHPEFAKRLKLIDRYRSEANEHQQQPARLQRRGLIYSGTSFAGSSEAELAAAEGLDLRDPTADEKVLAFCFSVPDHVFIDPETGLQRWLIREAMRGKLPDSVRLNTRRGRQAADLVPRLRSAAQEVNVAMAEIEHGLGAEYVSVPALRAAWRTVCTENTPEAFRLAVTVVTRGIMVGLFVNGFEKT
jgi:asparagine synthase (glutamine-hydrolysing)